MKGLRNKTKSNSVNKYYYCEICGKSDCGPDTLEVVVACKDWRNWVWAHGHCYAKLDVEFAVKSLEEARERLHQVKFDGPAAVKCLDEAMQELVDAKHCLIGKALWQNLC